MSIKLENYPNAYKEVYVILNNMNEKEKSAIPQEFLEMVEAKMNNDYEFQLQENVEFENQTLLRETKAILAYIFLNYWATEDQKTKIEHVFNQDIIEKEEEKGKYNPQELFNNKKEEESIPKEELQIVDYKKENIVVRLINRIKNLFKKN